jgi:hypothetical protein
MKIKLKQGVEPFRIKHYGEEYRIPFNDDIPEELYKIIKNKVSKVKPKETTDE